MSDTNIADGLIPDDETYSGRALSSYVCTRLQIFKQGLILRFSPIHVGPHSTPARNSHLHGYLELLLNGNVMEIIVRETDMYVAEKCECHNTEKKKLQARKLEDSLKMPKY